MCWKCFKKYADTPVVNERVAAAYQMVAKANGSYPSRLPFHWGRCDSSELLHSIVADMNVDDWIFGLDAETDWSKDAYAKAAPWEREIFETLKALTEEERATVIAMEWGYIAEDGTLRGDLT